MYKQRDNILDRSTWFLHAYFVCAQLAVGVRKVSNVDSGQSGELEVMKELYRKEALQRKLLYNKVLNCTGIINSRENSTQERLINS